MPIICSDIMPHRIYGFKDTGNYNPTHVPLSTDYVYVDLNAVVNGNGLTSATPTNVLPATLASGAQVYFNSDNGIQNFPAVDAPFNVGGGTDIQITSYGSGIAVLSGFQYFTTGWTQLPASSVWKRTYSGTVLASGPVVASVVDMTNTTESPQGDVLNWTNLENENNALINFQANPTSLASGFYAYDYQNQIMYINLGGANPNGRTIGIASTGYGVQGLSSNSPTRVRVHNLRFIGFVKQALNIIGGSSFWKVDNNSIYACGGMWNNTASSLVYQGGGIQMSHQTNNIEIAYNSILQVFDSPISPQHFGGSTGGNMHDIWIHHNTIAKWALAGVELSDFGTTSPGNQYSNITIEDNTLLKCGQGFSATGDTPQGFSDGIQIRAGNAFGSFNNLAIRRNSVQAVNNGFCILGNNFGSPVILEDNIFSGAVTGINNNRPTAASVLGNRNTLCGNATQLKDTAAASIYQNTTLVTGGCL